MIQTPNFHDGETIRRQRNLTETQKHTDYAVQQGVLVNNFYKPDFSEISDTFIISETAEMPKELKTKDIKPSKSLIPISAISVGVMGTIAGFTYFIQKNTKAAAKSAQEQVLPTLTRHVAINDETHQAIYRMVRNPNRQTILAGTGVIALTATAFMAKTFFDGFKEVWVKRKEADIQKNLQENLIAVETQTFSGKMKIIRAMLSEKTEEFKKALNSDDYSFEKLNFASNKNHELSPYNDEISAFKYFIFGVLTFGTILGLGFLSIKNLSKGKKYLDKNVEAIKNAIPEIIKNSAKETKAADKENLKNLFVALGTPKDYIKTQLKNLKWSNNEIKNFEAELTAATAKLERAIGGDGTDKPTFYSHVDDYRAHLYNYLLDTDNKQFKRLFFGIAGISALGYGGKLVGDAIKEVEVKKINAQTELELQKRLVSTELRNFKAKKEAAINPLIEEFYRQKELGKSNEELKTMADNILYEIKNGAPFVYA